MTASSVVSTESVTLNDNAARVDEVSTADTIEFSAYVNDIDPRPSDGCGTIPSITNGPNDGIDMQVGELNRQNYLYLPPGYDPQTPSSQVLSFHGFTDNVVNWQYGTGMNAQADKYGFTLECGEPTD